MKFNPPKVSPVQWRNLLKLLGLMVVADDKIYQEEVSMFSQAAMSLQQKISPDMIMTNKMTVDWFINYRDRLSEVVDSLDYDRAVIEIISELRGLEHKEIIIEKMIDIAKSDGAFHDKERIIIKKTILYWNIESDKFDLT